ncbi:MULTISPECIES: hypothetical protein [Cryobacterium]|uniref:hypothetical protein n=1 Tax=Cryobacterium TaxID=69578 RepID=UPI00106A3B44|nr:MULTISPECIES: hypothetical protein [Cryobacterium]TFD46288.1 hypothetical protein E3T33_05765 [Cryobacterium sp. TMT1-2-1]TFD84616.1 hypothetical protein E3T56_09100 [Cryobacterium psychrotolerans]
MILTTLVQRVVRPGHQSKESQASPGPDGLRALSPFTHTPALGTVDVDWTGAWWMLALAALLAALSLAAIRRRDLAL